MFNQKGFLCTDVYSTTILILLKAGYWLRVSILNVNVYKKEMCFFWIGSSEGVLIKYLCRYLVLIVGK